MTLNEYQHLASRTINKNLRYEEKLRHALFGLSGEVGEIHSIYQKVYQGHAIDYKELRREIGDLMWFVAELCTVLGYSYAEIAHQNIEKLKKRYPQGFDPERSVHRLDGDK